MCATCPFNSKNKKDYQTNRIDEHCTMCGCTITRKTAALTAECGIACCNDSSNTDCTCADKDLKAFNKNNKINMPVKWTAYKIKEDEQK